MAGIKKGASIELLSVGSIGEAHRIGCYWSEKLAHGATVRKISLQSVNRGWKITIKYEPREAAQ